jgi:hypothetical protein
VDLCQSSKARSCENPSSLTPFCTRTSTRPGDGRGPRSDDIVAGAHDLVSVFLVHLHDILLDGGLLLKHKVLQLFHLGVKSVLHPPRLLEHLHEPAGKDMLTSACTPLRTALSALDLQDWVLSLRNVLLHPSSHCPQTRCIDHLRTSSSSSPTSLRRPRNTWASQGTGPLRSRRTKCWACMSCPPESCKWVHSQAAHSLAAKPHTRREMCTVLVLLPVAEPVPDTGSRRMFLRAAAQLHKASRVENRAKHGCDFRAKPLPALRRPPTLRRSPEESQPSA